MTHREYVDLRNKIKNITDDASAKDAFEQLFKLLGNLKKRQIDYDAILTQWNEIMNDTQIKNHFNRESEEIKNLLESIKKRYENELITSFKSKYDDFLKKYSLLNHNRDALNERIQYINALING